MYGQQGPAQWAGQQNRQQYNSMQNLVNMLMQVKMMKHKETVDQGKWDQRQELEERELASLDRDRRERAKRLGTPEIPDYIQKAMLLGKYSADTQAGKNLRKVLKITNPDDEMAIFKAEADYKAKLNKEAGPSVATVGAQTRFDTARQDRFAKAESEAEKKKKKASWTRDRNYMKGLITRFGRERERMVKGLDPDNKKFMAKQQPRVANMDKGIAEVDRINSLLRSGEPLPPEEFDRAKNMLTNFEHIKSGLYDFATGKSSVVNTINEVGLTKEEKKRVMISPTTGEMFIEKDDGWYLVTKKK